MAAKKSARKAVAPRKTKSQASQRKNPKGGLTAKGRAYYAKTEGAHLKAGVTGGADTPEKMRRKGSFLRRFFTHLRGPLVDKDGKPTRLALSAHAWGEPVPKTVAAAHKLAAKGERLLAKYAAAKVAKKTAVKKRASKKSGAKKTATSKRSPRKAVKKKQS